MRRIVTLALLAFTANFASAQSQPAKDYLADNTVLIIRHAEKPVTGIDLTPLGAARAQAYGTYFNPFKDGELSIHIDSLYAGADSKSSIRPRLTLEPLSKTTGLPLHATISSKDPEALVAELRTQPHGKYPLIAWRHGEIPGLLAAFGASPEQLLPGGKWPDNVFDWVVVLNLGSNGQVVSAKVIHEDLHVAETVR